MRFRFSAFVILFLAVACSDVAKRDLKPGNYLSDGLVKRSLMLQLVQFTDKLPEGFTHEQRFDSLALPVFQQRASIHELSFLYPTDSVIYFQITRPAPSLFKERIAIGGWFTLQPNGKITDVEQLYVTPKLRPEELVVRTATLFRELVQTGNVKGFLSDRNYVNYPDSVNQYNSQLNKWEYVPKGKWN
ncbi:MAG TPA: hypothetical protein VFV37_02385 [Luteibaculaceae bacterium]|nr:hypothetical protein [Luteibaculaceae bacterium]